MQTCSVCILAFSGTEPTSTGILRSKLASWIIELTTWWLTRQVPDGTSYERTTIAKVIAFLNINIRCCMRSNACLLTNTVFLMCSAHDLLTLLSCSVRAKLVAISLTSIRKFPASFNWAWREVHSFTPYKRAKGQSFNPLTPEILLVTTR